MSARTAEIVAYLDDLLQIDRYADMGPNGLQVPGASTVTTIVTGVSAQLELFEQAVAHGAQLVITHHGILWEFEPRRVGPAQAKRLRTLLSHDVNLAAYHLPLDGHPEVGNNALIAAGLGADVVERAFDHKGMPIGAIAHFDANGGDGIAASELFSRVETLTDRAPLVFDAGPAYVRRLGIVSGSAANDLGTAIELGLDAFLTGEPKEHVMAQARENYVHFIAAGHYATETFGIRRIGELVAQRFGVDHHFVDVPNPV
ncbi:Nif3-like dinuclear metal center hexameric protein [Conexibacter stalactiti]|uniref:GTP cyclohydrolase 1 type 2 homolog n=1 Tax=Conexibacter stalactiti TaxID=1940611 RepID=A0ABU4HTM0_9ACTN|nr:Nif3-like dinuclear metal center hexameric protein [Conexibacter stalactiti]MDW5596017.1 Nif3-like dinuclear metal center hexameric protein [Conexibacter stalactiti]MEC5036659.1 Nif3-like dinuclear metal center hexameric protein [Conexibacter stalactiti]